MRLVILQSPACEPVSLREAKDYLRVEVDKDDALVTKLIKSARLLVEEFTSRSLIAQTWRLQIPSAPAPHESSITGYVNRRQDRILLPRSPFIKLAGCPKIDEHEVKKYHVITGFNQAMVCLNRELTGRESLQIDFVCGYGEFADDVPEVFKQAICTLVAEMYENRGGEVVINKGTAKMLKPYQVVRLT